MMLPEGKPNILMIKLKLVNRQEMRYCDLTL